MADESLDRARSGVARLRRSRLGRLALERRLITPEQLRTFEEDGSAALPLGAEQVRELQASLDAPGGRYELGEKLGEGAMSVVYGAFDRELGRPVAVKVMREGLLGQEAMRERFAREAQALARMDHPNVVKVYDAVDQSLVMELVRGEPLSRLMKREPRPALLRLLERAARGVQHAHEKGIIHRDLKPENILVAVSGEPKVADFGLAHLVESAPGLTRSGTVLGTPMYMAPEQAAGGGAGITERTDVYALGAILYEILAGEPPHVGTSIPEVYAKIARDEPRPSRSGDRALDAIAMKAIEKDPSRRYASAAAFAEDLRRAIAGEPVEARPVTAASHLWRRAVKQRAVVLPTLLAVAMAAWAWSGWRGRERQAEALKLLEAARPALERAKAADAGSMEEPLGEAEAGIARAIGLAPDLPLGPYREGEVWELRGRYERAEECWRRAVALDRTFGPAHYRLGRVLLWRAYLASLYFWPDQKEARQAEGEQLAREGAREIELAQGSGFDNDLQREIASAMLACLRKEKEAVRRICGEAIRRFGRKEGVEELHWLLGLVLEEPAEQKRAFDEALAARPKFPLALYCRAGVRNAMQDREGAIRDYDEAVRASPGFAEAYLHRGSIHYGFGRAEQAFEDFDRLIRMKALLPGAYNGRGRVLAELMGKPAEALPDLDRAVELMPEGYILPWLARAKAHLQLRHYDRAIADATKALSIRTWADVYAVRGLAREGKGDRAGAIEDLETALKGTTDPGPRKRLEEALDRLRR